jgi:sialate O-acetylesterase
MGVAVRIFIVLIFLVGLLPVSAEPRFANIFGDHAVLQQGSTVTVRGAGADPAAAYVVRLGDTVGKVTEVDAEGNWTASLSAQKASAEGRDLQLFENGKLVAVARDVVVGEVWLAAGQSNIQFQVKGMLRGMPSSQGWVDSAERPEIRFRRINDPVMEDGDAEASDLATADAWVRMSPETVLTFSAVAASYARKLADEEKVPVGIIDVSWGGKPIEPFIPREAFSTPLLENIKALADGEKLDQLAALRGGVIIRNPQGYPGAIFNARMAPLTQFGLRGFLWYQAESNAGKGEDPREYRHKVTAMVGGWRARWENEELPCYFVQLPSFPPAPGWIRIREEQRRALSIANTGMAVTIDIRGDDIHPADKVPVGERLARLALAQTYDREDVVASGPLYRDHVVEGSRLRVRFDFADAGLMVGDRPDAGPVVETADVPLRWFEVAGEDGVWHPATAKIEGGEVLVSSDAVAAPIAVRYACDTQPQGGNLYHRAGLPASPFCSKLEWLPWEKP